MSFRTAWLVSVFCFAGTSLWAQRNAASIFGSVTDSSGAPVPAAGVRLTELNTGLAKATESDEIGNFAIADLAPGAYRLEVSKTGFKQYVNGNVFLNVDQRPQINVVLTVGDTTETVTVTDSVPLVEATHANVGGVVENAAVQQLPLNGRQFLQLTLLLPGVSPAAGGQTVSRGGGPRQVGVQLGGNRATNNTYLIDGVDSFGFRFKNASLRPSVASMQEFKVLEAPYDAQYGVASGITVNVITKSGGNQLHGELFEFLRNDKLDARNFFDITKPAYRQNQFGGTLGFPILHDRTFGFISYEGLKVRRGQAIGSIVPTARQLQGDFSQDSLVIRDPLTNTPFPGNQIPVSRVRDVSRNFLALYPAPNTSLTSPNYINSSSDRIDEYQWVARLDHSLRENIRLFARYSISNVDRYTPGSLPQFGTFNLMTVQNAALGATYVVSPKSIVDLRIGFNREDARNSSEQIGLRSVSEFGIAGLSAPPDLDGVPNVSVLGMAGLGDASYSPETRVENSEQILVNATYVAGRHSLRYGANFWLTQLNNVSAPGRQRGAFTFNAALTGGSTGLPALMLGTPTQADLDIGVGREDARATLYNFYFMDDFRISRRLTLNLGLRYELRPAFVDKQNRLSTFIPEGVGRFAIAGDPNNGFTGRANRALYPTPKTNFAPRFGFAYDLTGDSKTVLRGGYGIFWNLAIFNSQFLSALNAPFVVARTYQSSPAQGLILDLAAPFSNNPIAGGLPGGLMITSWFQQGYMQQWSMSVQRQLSANFSLDLTYLANKGTSLDSLRIINQGALPGTPNAAYFRPFPNFGLFTAADSHGDSIYHSLQARLTRRFAKGFLFIGSYNWGHAIDNSSGEGGGSGGQFVSMDDRNTSLDRGHADFDVRHRVAMSGVYDLPFGVGKRWGSSLTGIPGKLAEGWQVNAIWQWQTGLPLNVAQSGNRTGTFGGTERANRSCDGNLSGDQRTRERWFDTSCFSVAPLGVFGNSPRGAIRYDGLNSLDFSVIKRTSLAEARYLEFRAEAFNLLNHTKFSNSGLGNNVTAPAAFGVYTAANDPRILQFALRLVF
jgi:hypothetical protein